MRLLVLGATGGTGLAVTTQALERGHHVTAFVRSPDKLTARHERLRVVGGDPCNVDHLAPALPGHDAVVSTLGTRTRGPTTICADGARSTVGAMQRASARRLLVVSSALLCPDIGALGSIVRLFFKDGLTDAREMERLVAQSELDWTVVRPPRLTNGKPKGGYRVSGGKPYAGSITRADLARCLLDEVEQCAHSREVISVSR